LGSLEPARAVLQAELERLETPDRPVSAWASPAIRVRQAIQAIPDRPESALEFLATPALREIPAIQAISVLPGLAEIQARQARAKREILGAPGRLARPEMTEIPALRVSGRLGLPAVQAPQDLVIPETSDRPAIQVPPACREIPAIQVILGLQAAEILATRETREIPATPARPVTRAIRDLPASEQPA
jgi:hypothetical protein